MRSRRLAPALVASAAMHVGLFALVWAAARFAPELPKVRSYAVDIVSLPPQTLGPPDPGETVVPEPQPQAPAPEEPAPTPEPAPPTPPAPTPAAKPELSRPTAPTREPKPAPPKPAPAATPPAPKPTAPPKPAEAKPAEPKPAEAKPARPSSGRAPAASTAGGDGLNVRIEGERFSDPAYLENIIRQVNRYFRPPGDARAEVAEVRFWINRDGSISDIQVVRSVGSFLFRAAAMEAVEQAGVNKSFGPLPKSYTPDRLPVSFEFKPAQ